MEIQKDRLPIITDEELKEIILPTDKLVEKTNTVSPRIDDEIPNVAKYIKTFSNIKSFDKDGSIIYESYEENEKEQ